MDGSYKSPVWSPQFSANTWEGSTQSERTPLGQREEIKDETNTNSNISIVTQPALALNGQPYPTLPFSLGGYGLECNINQLTMSRRLGKDMPRQRRSSLLRHKRQLSSRPHKRKLSMPHSSIVIWRENTNRRNSYRIQPQTQPVLVHRFPKFLSSHENDQRIFRDVIWQTKAEANLRHINNPNLDFFASWPQQQAFNPQPPPASHFLHPLPRRYGEDSRFLDNSFVGTQIHQSRHFNEEPWLKMRR